MHFEEEDTRTGDEDPEFTDTAKHDDVDDEFLSDDAPLLDDESDLDDSDDEEEGPTADL